MQLDGNQNYNLCDFSFNADSKSLVEIAERQVTMALQFCHIHCKKSLNKGGLSPGDVKIV